MIPSNITFDDHYTYASIERVGNLGNPKYQVTFKFSRYSDEVKKVVKTFDSYDAALSFVGKLTEFKIRYDKADRIKSDEIKRLDDLKRVIYDERKEAKEEIVRQFKKAVS